MIYINLKGMHTPRWKSKQTGGKHHVIRTERKRPRSRRVCSNSCISCSRSDRYSIPSWPSHWQYFPKYHRQYLKEPYRFQASDRLLSHICKTLPFGRVLLLIICRPRAFLQYLDLLVNPRLYCKLINLGVSQSRKKLFETQGPRKSHPLVHWDGSIGFLVQPKREKFRYQGI